MEEPENTTYYNHNLVDGINIYTPTNLKTIKNEIRIKYSKFLWKKLLIVEGLKTNQI